MTIKPLSLTEKWCNNYLLLAAFQAKMPLKIKCIMT